MTTEATKTTAASSPLERRVGRLEPERASARALGMQDVGAKQLADLAMTCALACATGQPTVTISARGKRPAGFPRGELLSVGNDGTHNYAAHPVKVLEWLHGLTSKTPNRQIEPVTPATEDR